MISQTYSMYVLTAPFSLTLAGNLAGVKDAVVFQGVVFGAAG